VVARPVGDVTGQVGGIVIAELITGGALILLLAFGSFFAMLLQNTKEGYFSDPIYGGNKDMGAWKMIGFPGAHYNYTDWVTRHGEAVPFPPVGFKGRPGWTET